MVEEKDLEKMHLSSKGLVHEESEAKVFNIETIQENTDFPPRIATAPVAYYCELNQEIDLGGGSTIPLILNVHKMFVNDEVITDQERLTIAFNPVARIGKSYAFLGDEIEAPMIP